MKRTMWTRWAGAALACALAFSVQLRTQAAAAEELQGPVVQIAILLDTSNSMDGLIDQARGQLWKVVNEFAKARVDGKRPVLQVALYQYGTPSLGQDNGFIRQLTPLTEDLDKVSEELFKLHTDGGDEYCGWVIRTATDELKWSTQKGAYKAIFIAGNEPFTQGTVNYKDACKAAISKGIMINTIYCGGTTDADASLWHDGASLADGSFMSIDQNHAVAAIATPQDKELAELGAKLNSTYVAFGINGAGGVVRQQAQDQNSANAPAAAAERAVTKSSTLYQNSTWDLVDAQKKSADVVNKLKTEELPPEMQKMSADERKKYLTQKEEDRAAIQKQIAELAKKRSAYIAAEQAKQAKGAPSTLDVAMIGAIHQQAAKVNMQFDGATKAQPGK